MDKQAELKAIVERYVDAYNRFDVEGMMADMDNDVHFENVSNGEVTHAVTGLAELRALALQAVGFFSERNEQIRDIRAEESKVEIRVSYRATLAKDLWGMKAGHTLELKGTSVFTFKDNKIIGLKDIS